MGLSEGAVFAAGVLAGATALVAFTGGVAVVFFAVAMGA
jgi:hypothetical protein